MAEPYALEQTPDGPVFTTSAGIVYAVLFREQQAVLFPAFPQLQHHLFTFAFFPINISAEKMRPDERIMPTIVKAIRDKFADKQNVVVFVVEDSDDRQDGRWRLFESLNAAARNTDIELISGALAKGEKAVMSAILIHTANPFRKDVIGQFFALVARMSKD